MKIHRLKTCPEDFIASQCGKKPFEIRKNDCNFEEGDLIILEDQFTGEFLFMLVTYVTDFEQKRGYVVMGVRQARFEVA